MRPEIQDWFAEKPPRERLMSGLHTDEFERDVSRNRLAMFWLR